MLDSNFLGVHYSFSNVTLKRESSFRIQEPKCANNIKYAGDKIIKIGYTELIFRIGL